MKYKISLFTFSLCVMLFLGCFGQISACWCRSESSCESANRASAVFVGKVLKIEPDEKLEKNEVSFLPKNKITFQIRENFLETKEKIIVVKTGGTSDCDFYSFETGETYLVYAYKNEENLLEVGLCGGTKTLAKASEDLNYLRNLPEGFENSAITGSVYGPSFDAGLHQYSETSLSGILLLLSGNGVNKTILTNQRGEYEFNNLKAGKYRLEVFLPDFYSLAKYGDDYAVSEVFLNGKGCSKDSFFPEVKNSLEGKVLDINGKPLKGIEVYLFPEIRAKEDAENNYSERTDENGNYKFEFIFPGRYILGIKTDESSDEEAPDLFYPNTQIRSQASIMDFGLGNKLNNYDLIWQNTR